MDHPKRVNNEDDTFWEYAYNTRCEVTTATLKHGTSTLPGWTAAIKARYTYDAFGQKNRAYGVFVATNPFGFSSKYEDSETGLLYYGYRYYDPVGGRWPSRDPIGEQGGLNLYGFVGNNGVNRWDYLGLKEACAIKEIRIDFFAIDMDKMKTLRGYDSSGKYNHPTGYVYEGNMTTLDEGGGMYNWIIQSGVMRMTTSAVRGPSSSNPVGDDSSMPAGSYRVQTSPSGGAKGYKICNHSGR